ncbi:MAG: alanine/ornithine racemase family PLP-dependent enzyme [bacterium]|nr:alanine/ornithine racemase family PLP-dependent enzyme [bacterium]
MSVPRLDIDLRKIHDNASALVDSLGHCGISVTGVTKAMLGCPAIADAFLQAGVRSLGDSRIENIETLRTAHVSAPIAMIRSPMMSQAARVVASADSSFNTEVEVIQQLSAAAESTGKKHGVVLMVELGDLREGIMPADLECTVSEAFRLPGITVRGVGTNLACRYGVVPDQESMDRLSALADSIEATFGLTLDVVSGGNSANLKWAFGNVHTGKINDLRLGESMLLGRDPVDRRPIAGLHTDAITLVAEVIESKIKPSRPTGATAQAAFGDVSIPGDRGLVPQAILAVGRQDVDPDGLQAQPGVEISGASSDHLIVHSGRERLPVGTELWFEPNYSALLRAMTSPFVSKVIRPVRAGNSPAGPTEG